MIKLKKNIFKKISNYIYIQMPKPKNYGWESAEAMMENRRKNDNIQKKVAYWRKKYNFDLNKNDYNTFIKYIPVVKKVYQDLERFLTYDKNRQMSDNDFHFFANNYEKLKLVQDNREYLETLRRIIPITKPPIVLTF